MTFSLDADEVVRMPLDALALAILRDVAESGEWNSYNWMNSRQQDGAFGRRPDALRAFEEAWAWLRAKALVAHTPEQSHEAAIFVTRRGHQALKDGLALTRAEERLDVDPHPRIAQTVRSQFLLGEYELAALAAFREVEIRVRSLGGFEDDVYGVDLMRKAFGPMVPSATLAFRSRSAAQSESSSQAAMGPFAIPRATAHSILVTSRWLRKSSCSPICSSECSIESRYALQRTRAVRSRKGRRMRQTSLIASVLRYPARRTLQ